MEQTRKTIDGEARASATLSRAEAPGYLAAVHSVKVAYDTLAKAAVSGDGPRYMLSGRQVLYSTDDLDDWARARLRGPFRSTAEAKQQGRGGSSPHSPGSRGSSPCAEKGGSDASSRS